MSEAEPDDKMLAARALAGEQAAYSALMRRHRDAVWRLARGHVGDADEALDITQESFVAAFAALSRYDGERPFRTWIARIAYSTAVDYLRKYRKKNMIYEAQEHDLQDMGDLSPEELLVQTDVSGYVRKLVDQLPEQYRLILTLYHLDEFSYEEIKQITGLPEGTVKSYLFRSRKLLKEKLVSYLKQDKQ